MAERLFLRDYIRKINRVRNLVIKRLAESDGWREYLRGYVDQPSEAGQGREVAQ